MPQPFLVGEARLSHRNSEGGKRPLKAAVSIGLIESLVRAQNNECCKECECRL